MKSEESFYLHVDGQQKGPYTIRHIDHLLNSGLIDENTLFLREGMEQWLPVTELVARRKPEDRWRWVMYAVPAAVILVLVLAFFGPPATDGWREVFQHDYSARAAYWRAREAVRSRGGGERVLRFAGFAESSVQLEGEEGSQGGDGAEVILRASMAGPSGEVRSVRWRVRLGFDRERREWMGVDVVEAGESEAPK
ncbi:MAG: domain 2 [Verrucomicrobiota bacterium]